MSASQEARKQLAQVIKEKFQNAKSVVFVKSNGLTVAEDTELRNQFRKNDVEYRVYKNTLIKYALHDLGITEFDDDLNGPTSVAFGQDETNASKIVVDTAKKFDTKFEVKSGYVDGNKVDVNGIKMLASIPSKEQLIAKMLGSLKSPISNLVYALNAIAQKNA